MNRLFFTLIIICIASLTSMAQQTFELAKNVENAQVKSLKYDGFSDGFVVYSYTETNGAFKYTFNIFDKNLTKLATKSYPYTKGTQVYQFISNKNSFCLVMGNSEKKAIDIYSYDKKGKRIGKKAINSNSISKISKLIKAMESKRIGKDVKGMDLFVPKVVAAEDGYFIITQNPKTKEGYEIEKCSSKLRKEWTKTMLPNDKEFVSFGALKQKDDNLAVVSLLREKIADEEFEMKLDIYKDKGEEEKATISYELEEDGNALFPNKMMFEEDNSIVIAGNYYSGSKIKANNLDGVFVLKVDESGDKEFANLISWDDKLKKIAKTERSTELKYVCQSIMKQNKYYNLVLELYKTSYKDVTDYTNDDKKKQDEVMVPYYRGLDLMVLKTDNKSGALNKSYVVKKEDTNNKISDFTLTENELMLDMMFKNPDYFAYKYDGKEENLFFVHAKNDTEYNVTTINKAGKPITRPIEFINGTVNDNDNNGMLQFADNQVIMYSFDEDNNAYNYWTENFSKAYKEELKIKEEAAELKAEEEREAAEKIKLEEEAKAAIKEKEEKAKKAMENVEGKVAKKTNITSKKESTTAKKPNATAKKESTTAKKEVSSTEKLDEKAARKKRMDLLKKKLAEKRKEAEEKEAE